jgi:hypothetical protein
VTTRLDAVRQEWAEGRRRLEAARDDRARYRRLHDQADAVAAELRRRIGSVFTLAELANEYDRAEGWAQSVYAELPDDRRDLAALRTTVDAGFFLYARGAQDYAP